MYRIIFFGLLFIIPHLANAQEKTKYWIFLTDKHDLLGKSTQVEEGHLSNKALTRRALRGEARFESMFALQDAPISNIYEEDLQERGLTIEQRSRWLNAVTARLTEEELEQVTHLPYVRSLRPVARLSPTVLEPTPISPVIPERISSNCPSSVYGRSCSQLDIVNAIPAIEEDINGNGVTLGFLDTNYRVGQRSPLSHPSLTHIEKNDQLKEVRNFTQRDSSQPCLGTNDHGMAVASVAVGYDIGKIVGPGYGADIYAAVTECEPYERNIEEDNFVAAVEWMEAEGVDVITSSLGYLGFDPGQRSYTKDDLDGNTGLTTIAMDWAANRGIIPVTSSGNSGPGRQTLGTPADGDSVIAVGAVSPFREIALFSSRGPTADGRVKPDVSAQGVSVYRATGESDYRFSRGTSFSAPMVAGIITQILQVNPDLGPREVWEVLTSKASHANSPNNEHGWGIVDAHASITHAISLNRLQDNHPPNPDNLTIHTPYPNPFRDVVHFTLDAIQPVSHARLIIFDVLGREVGTVYQGPIQMGGMPLQFDGSHLPPGIYGYVLDFDGKTHSGMLTRLGY